MDTHSSTHAPESLELLILPAGQDVVVELKTPEIAAAVRELREWIWRCGYLPLGPAWLSWNEWATRELHQPIAPVFAPQADASYHVVERSEALVVALPITTVQHTFNLAGVYDLVQEYGLDAIGAPLIPWSPSVTDASTPTLGYVPVVPLGTSSLIPISSWIARKVGFQVTAPTLGEQLPKRVAWQQTGLIVLRTSIAMLLAAIVALPYLGLCAWSSGVLRAGLFQEIVLASLIPTGVVILLMQLLIGGIMLRIRQRAIERWNSFWSQLPDPAILFLTEDAEDDGV